MVILEGDAVLPEGTQVTVVPTSLEHGPLHSLTEAELKRRKEACERLEVFAERIAKTAKPTLNLGEDVIEARRELEGRV
jgi:hypothetical protein